MSTFPLSYSLGLFQQLFVFTVPHCCTSFYLAITAVAHRRGEVSRAGELESNTNVHKHSVYVLVYNVCLCVCARFNVCAPMYAWLPSV